MNCQVHVLLAAIAALCLAPTTSIAQEVQVPLTPSSVIGGSGSISDGRIEGTCCLWDSTDEEMGSHKEGFSATRIADGVMAEDGEFNMWLVGAGSQNSAGENTVTIDLGAQYAISRIDLYNTHNRRFNNFGTDEFRIDASTTVAFVNDDVDFDLSGDITTILTGNLSSTADESPITTVDSFPGLNPSGNFRYLRFAAISGIVEGNPDGRGLNEIQVWGTVIPEPSTLVLAALSLLGVLGFTRRRGK